MSELKGKIDFVLLVTATNANPNGDPSNGNRPRENMEGYGEISDVCIKRKIRNRWQDMGARIFVQSDDRCDDNCTSLKKRADSCAAFNNEIKKKDANQDACMKVACQEWMDVRSFGQVFAFKGATKGSGLSLGVRGPVSIQIATSVSPIEIISMSIVKSVNSVDSTDKKSKSADTMGTKNRIAFGLYTIKGSVNVQLAEKTGFSKEDAEMLKEALLTLFENDTSSARPEGSLEVCQLYWWQHEEKTPKISTAKIHKSIQIKELSERPTRIEDYEITYKEQDCVKPEVFNFV